MVFAPPRAHMSPNGFHTLDRKGQGARLILSGAFRTFLAAHPALALPIGDANTGAGDDAPSSESRTRRTQ